MNGIGATAAFSAKITLCRATCPINFSHSDVPFRILSDFYFYFTHHSSFLAYGKRGRRERGNHYRPSLFSQASFDQVSPVPSSSHPPAAIMLPVKDEKLTSAAARSITEYMYSRMHPPSLPPYSRIYCCNRRRNPPFPSFVHCTLCTNEKRMKKRGSDISQHGNKVTL